MTLNGQMVVVQFCQRHWPIDFHHCAYRFRWSVPNATASKWKI